MTVKTVHDAAAVLAGKSLTSALFGSHGRNATVNADYLIEDGRIRKRLWRELTDQGYIENAEGGVGVATDKAYKEMPMADVVTLADFYTYDEWQDRKQGNKPYVVWDRLNPAQQKLVIEQAKLNPLAFTFVVVDRYDESKQHPFHLGNAGAAMDAVGGWSNGILAVRDVTVQEKRDAAAKAHYKAECMQQGLNWFLHQTGAFEKEEEVPVVEKQPFLGGGPALPRNPAEWQAGLPKAIEDTKERIRKARERLALLEKLESYVERIGGWKVFLADYESAIDRYVAEAVQQGKV